MDQVTPPDFANIAQTLSKASAQRNKKPKLNTLKAHFLSTPLGSSLLFHEQYQAFYTYDPLTCTYLPLTRLALEAHLDDFLSSHYAETVEATQNTLSELIHALERPTIDSPPRIPTTTPPSTVSTFSDGTAFDFQTLEASPASQESKAFHHFPFPFPISPSPTPIFDAFLQDTFSTPEGTPDPALADFALDILAYYLSPMHANDPFAVILMGGGANGKSVFLYLLELLIQPSHIASLSLEDLSDKYGAAQLLNKRLNIVSEDQSTRVRTDKLKAIISRDQLKAERKYEHSFFFRPDVKHIISTNKELKFEDIDYAITRRLYLIQFHRTFVHNPPLPYEPAIDNKRVLPMTPNLKQLLKEELQGIAYKLIERLHKLKEHGYQLTPPLSLELANQELRSASSSALEFLLEHYTYDQSYTTPHSNIYIYLQYKRWYEEEERERRYLLRPRQFWAIITKNYPGTQCEERMIDPLTQKRTRTHIRLRPTTPLTPHPPVASQRV